MEPEFAAYSQCWNEGRFFEAHEVLEGLWMRTRDECQRGLIQLAAALYHTQRRNLKGARTMLDRAIPRIKASSRFAMPLPTAALAAYAERVRAELEEDNGDRLVAERPPL